MYYFLVNNFFLIKSVSAFMMKIVMIENKSTNSCLQDPIMNHPFVQLPKELLNFLNNLEHKRGEETKQG